MAGFDQYEALLKKLGKLKTNMACLLIKKIKDIDLPMSRESIEQSVKLMAESRPQAAAA